MSDELTPITRKETFLAKAGGQNVVTPTPITREETFLQAIIDNGSGGGGGGGAGTLVVHEDDSTLDKTWNEIATALSTGTIVLLVGSTEYDGSIIEAYAYIIDTVRKASASAYNVYFLGNTSEPNYIATSADGYPVANED